MTDAEWAAVAPLLPKPSPLGRSRRVDLRVVVDALIHVRMTGCLWRELPRTFPPISTVQGYFYRWARDGVCAQVNEALARQARVAAAEERALPGVPRPLLVLDGRNMRQTSASVAGGQKFLDAFATRRIVPLPRHAKSW